MLKVLLILNFKMIPWLVYPWVWICLVGMVRMGEEERSTVMVGDRVVTGTEE